ncbi:replication initiator protein [Apis mellifera associated microvirus 58]|nr:replication initiator protein [Apis mellifera associated microvirus 58]
MCFEPYPLKYKGAKLHLQGMTIPVPCGKCPKCTKARINSWLFRLTIHARKYPYPLFITLTYDDKHLPVHSKSGRVSLDKSDPQKWFKRLRKSLDGQMDLSYFLVGEYGTKRKRPHYHVLLYGLPHNKSELIYKTWGLGFTMTLPVLDGGMRYVLKYMAKPRSNYTSKLPEFSLMSKNIGANYLTPQMIRYHLEDPAHTFASLGNGIKLALPKYYKEKIFGIDTPERKRVTDYLQKRAEMAQNSYLRRLSLNNRCLSQEEIIKLAFLRQHSLSYDKRLQESF